MSPVQWVPLPGPSLSFGAFEPFPSPASLAVFSPPAAAWRDTPDALVLEIRTPGYRRRDLTLEADGRSLRVRGERRRGLFRPSYQAFEERFSLPTAVEPEGVRAGFRDGVLWVSVAKRPEARRRVIPVSMGTSAPDVSK